MCLVVSNHTYQFYKYGHYSPDNNNKIGRENVCLCKSSHYSPDNTKKKGKESVLVCMYERASKYHVNDLHQREAEGELQRVALVDHGPLQHVVVVQQVVQQPLFVVPAACS